MTKNNILMKRKTKNIDEKNKTLNLSTLFKVEFFDNDNRIIQHLTFLKESEHFFSAYF